MRKKAAMSDELRAEYEKQLRRIKRFIRSATKRGYEFPDSAIPKHPKVITEASVRRVASVTPDTLYKKATYTKHTGEKLTGIEARKEERSRAAFKAAETRKGRMPGLGIEQQQGVRTPTVKSTKTKDIENKPKKERKKAESKPKKDRNKNEDDEEHKKRVAENRKKGAEKAKQTKAYKKELKKALGEEDEPKKQKTNTPRKKKSSGKKKEKEEKPSEKFYKNKEQKGKSKGKREDAPDRTNVVLDSVLNQLQYLIDTWQPDPNWTASLTIYKTRDKNVAENILNSAIEQLGREQVAKNCEDKASEIIQKLEEILYASGSKEGNFKDGRTQVNFDIIEFQNMLLGRVTTAQENIELSDLMERMLYEDSDEDTDQYRASVTYDLPTTEETKYSPKKKDPYKWS